MSVDELIGAALCSCLFIGACRADTSVDGTSEAIIYGDDDRRDVYETEEPFAHIAHSTAVALLAPSQLEAGSSGAYAIHADSYGELQMLCPGERFAEQPAAASCSAVLLAPDVVATAGHCLGIHPDGSPDCTNNRYVFGFEMDEPGQLASLPSSNVVECRRVLGRVKTAADAPCRYDFVLLQLDREASTAVPATLRDEPVQPGEALAVVGFPAGLPVKIDRGAKAVDARATQGDYFTLNSDTFAVNSGSGVFDVEGRLVGLFARGRRDYDADADCQRVHREVESTEFEEATHIAPVRALLQAITDPSEPAVAVASQCNVADFAVLTPSEVAQRHSASCATFGVGERGASWFSWLMLMGLLPRRRLRRMLR